jgi:predicted metal-binding protein
MIATETLLKVNEFYLNRSQLVEIIQVGDIVYSIQFVNGAKGRVVAELTNIETNEVVHL